MSLERGRPGAYGQRVVRRVPEQEEMEDVQQLSRAVRRGEDQPKRLPDPQVQRREAMVPAEEHFVCRIQLEDISVLVSHEKATYVPGFGKQLRSEIVRAELKAILFG